MATIKGEVIMDYKEKYEMALEGIQEILGSGEDSIKMSRLQLRLQGIFPELKESDESEDEEIRNYLINFVKINEGINLPPDDAKKALAWLEEQGNHSDFLSKIQIGDKVTRNEDGVLVNLSQLKRVAKPAEKQGEPIGDTDTVDSNEDGLIAATIEYANKVKPKFKVGDWIITNKKHIWYVDETPETTSYLYRLINQYGKVEVAEFEIVDEKARLWTIQDAKDGDVLTCNEEILLFKSYSVQGRISLYCWYNGQTNNFHSKEVDDMSVTTRNKICPTTKEQRDTLMKAMADAGYTFDFEKKELKKIELQLSQWNISDFRTWQYIVSDVLTKHDGIGQYLDDGFCKKIAQDMQEEWSKKLSLGQNPAWSEEDENRINRLIAYFEDKESFSAEDDIVYANWFKTLKERVQFQPKQGWSEEDKNMLQSILDEYKSMPTEKRNWLKSLRDRVQTKRKWSEEDSRILYNVKAYIGYAAGQRGVRDNLFKEANEWLNSLPIGFVYNKNYNEDMVKLLVGELKQIANDNNAPEQYRVEINWLKSLRPQPRQEWSEEDEKIYQSIIDDTVQENQLDDKQTDWLRNIKYRHFSQPQKQWKPSDLPHWKKSTLPNDNTTGFNSDYFCHNGYCINYKELFEKLPKDD